MSNPAAGFAFVEFATSNPSELTGLWDQMGFALVARHKTLPVTLYRQGNIYFIFNQIADSFAAQFAQLHGPAAVAAGFYVTDPAKIQKLAEKSGHVPVMMGAEYLSKPIQALSGIGGSLIYLIEAQTPEQLFATDFNFIAKPVALEIGLNDIDHLSFNVQKDTLEHWADFYKDIFGFKEIRYFHIQGKQTALRSRALLSSCETMRITINESMDEKSQIAEFLETYKGAGIQHIALHPTDIYATVESMKSKGIPFVPVPASYYEMLAEKFPDSGEDIARMQKNYILLDGANENREVLLQIVTPPIVGPLFFEIIQRKGCDGFGEGNFTALFEALERDQIARGVLEAA